MQHEVQHKVQHEVQHDRPQAKQSGSFSGQAELPENPKNREKWGVPTKNHLTKAAFLCTIFFRGKFFAVSFCGNFCSRIAAELPPRKKTQNLVRFFIRKEDRS